MEAPRAAGRETEAPKEEENEERRKTEAQIEEL